MTQYVLNLAKYDQNYDIRDRARFIRQLIVPTEKSGALSKYAKKLFLALKPAPVLESPFKGKEIFTCWQELSYFWFKIQEWKWGLILANVVGVFWGIDRDHFQLGSLSHLLNAKAGGYQELPDWPETAPDPSVRNVEVKESVRAVGTVTYRDTWAPWVLQGSQKMEGSEGCSCPRAVPQRGKTVSPQPDILYQSYSNITLLPPAIRHSPTAHAHLQHPSTFSTPPGGEGLRTHERGFTGMPKDGQQRGAPPTPSLLHLFLFCSSSLASIQVFFFFCFFLCRTFV